MTEKELLEAVHALPEAQQCYITRKLLAEHVVKHGTAIMESYQTPAWVKCVWGAVAALLGAAATASLTSCSAVTPAQLQGAHALYHAATGKPCIIRIEEGK